MDWTTELEIHQPLMVDVSFSDSVQPLLDDGLSEPIGFTLLAEAAALADTTTRGSLVMAMVALEVGVKDFIGELVPDARWLAMEVPSPPIYRILGQYLHQLPVRLELPSGGTRPPPDATLTIIKDANRRRNSVAHAGGTSSARFVKETLDAVNDVLRLLDYYLGYEWAVEHMTPRFATELGFQSRTAVAPDDDVS